jgi:hypothetical protein
MRLSVTRIAKICPIEIAANISPCVIGKIAQFLRRPYYPNYRVVFPASFALAPLAFAPAPSFNVSEPAAICKARHYRRFPSNNHAGLRDIR